MTHWNLSEEETDAFLDQMRKKGRLKPENMPKPAQTAVSNDRLDKDNAARKHKQVQRKHSQKQNMKAKNGDMKYKNHKTMVDGIIFDSKRESERYCELKMLKAAGQIKDFELQPKFKLQDAYFVNGKKIRAINYVADFLIYMPDGSKIVEDVKSPATAKDKVYRLKKKILLYNYTDLNFREVINGVVS